MNSFKIAIINFKRNIKIYGLYFMTMAFSVATYYNFSSMRYNPQFLEAKEVMSYIDASSISASMLMILFFIFFIIYSGNFFLNQRKKEVGIYAFMGVDNYKIALIFASEGLLLGSMSLIIGLMAGIVFSRLFMMILAKVALLDIRIKFFLSPKVLVETTVIYLIILSFTFLKGYIDILRTELIDLMNTLKKEEELPKVNYGRGLASIVIIGAAYYIAKSYADLGFAKALMAAVLLIIWGTYWLLGSFAPIIMRYYIREKSILYKGTNIISISNMVFRIKNNYRTLTAVSILITVCITSFGTVSSLRHYVKENYDIETPYTISYISDDVAEREKVDDIIKNSWHNTLLKNTAKFIYIPDREVVAVGMSTFENVLYGLNLGNKEKLISKLKLGESEAVYIENPRTMMSLYGKKDIYLGNEEFSIKATIKVPFFGCGVPFPCIVVRDEKYNVLKSSYQEKQFNGLILDKPKDTMGLTIQMAEFLTEDSWLYNYLKAHTTLYDFTGIIYFLGAFLFLVFVFAAGSIIYFKIISESFQDKNKYEIIKKLGATDLEIKESIAKQIGIFFILPLVVGTMHSIVAITVLSDIMGCSLTKPTIISIGIFSIIYGIFYELSKRKLAALMEI